MNEEVTAALELQYITILELFDELGGIPTRDQVMNRMLQVMAEASRLGE